MELLVNSLKDFCLQHGFNRTFWVAYSGGLDSHALLNLLIELRAKIPLQVRVIHINHGLSPNSYAWQNHCAAVCHQLKVEFVTRAINFCSKHKSPEATARDFRYQVFKELIAPNDFLLTAHHADDQAETVLLQMLRGAGPKGLAAMPALKKLGHGFHARPLLNFMRSDLESYATQKNLGWIEDESNVETRFTRNFLRHEILPILKQRWPSVTKTLTRVAENCAENMNLLNELSQHDLTHLKGSVPNTLSVKKLLLLAPSAQRHVLRAWLTELNFPVPSAIKLKQIQKDMLQAKMDKNPHFKWQDIELRRYRNDLFAMLALPKQDTAVQYEWDLTQTLLLPNIGTLSIIPYANKILKKVIVHFRQGGEVIQLHGNKKHQQLKKLFQTWAIPPWERDSIPLISIDNKLVAVVGYGIDVEHYEQFKSVIFLPDVI